MTLTRLSAALALASVATAAQSVPQFESGANIIELAAVAVDDHGAPVLGLQESDFQIEEDGRLMPISAFKAINADSTESPSDRRFIILWLDETIPERANSIKRVARLFATQMSDHDFV